MKKLLNPICLPFALLMSACVSTDDDLPQERPAPPMELIEGSPMYTLMPHDGIPSISEPEFVTVAEAEEFMAPSEPVLGVVGKDGSTKCYSAWQLDGHEIVNDTIDGEAIAATW